MNLSFRYYSPSLPCCVLACTVGSGDFEETIIGHGQTGNGPDANEFPSTTEKKDSRSYATVVRGTKRFVRPEE